MKDGQVMLMAIAVTKFAVLIIGSLVVNERAARGQFPAGGARHPQGRRLRIERYPIPARQPGGGLIGRCKGVNSNESCMHDSIHIVGNIARMLVKRPPPNSHPGSLMASLNTMESQFQTSMLGSEAE